METKELLTGAIQRAHNIYEAILADIPEEIFFWQPGTSANNISGLYLHTLLWQDYTLNRLLQDKSTFWETEWSQKLGIEQGFKGLPEWEWSSQVRYDIPTARQYSGAVQEATLAALPSLISRMDETINAGVMGQQSVANVIYARFLRHKHSHGGEIACLKGIRGLKGLPI